MLNKDQYNQEEYNNYYQQETRGAEINPQEESTGGNKLFLIIGLIVLAIAGYFGYKTLGTNDSDTTDEELVVEHSEMPPMSQQQSDDESLEIVEVEEVVKTAPVKKETVQENVKTEATVKVAEKIESIKEVPTTEKEVKTEEKEVATNKENEKETLTSSIEKIAGAEQKMTPEEIAKVVQLVMSQMNQKQNTAPKVAQEKANAKASDTDLMSALSGTDVDSVKEDKSLEDALSKVDDETEEKKKVSNSKEIVDTYNKVNVENISGEDELSKLSGQISNLISDKKNSEHINNSEEGAVYTESLKDEVVVRSNEMRIIVVKRGDTLGRIAKRAYGNVMDYKRIFKANPDILKRADKIYVGQKLRIPK